MVYNITNPTPPNMEPNSSMDEAKIKYESPNYKVWVGDYITKIEADKNLLKLREFFPQAFIFMTNK